MSNYIARSASKGNFFPRAAAVVGILEALYGRYKGRLLFLTVLGFFDGILGALSITALVPLFTFVIRGVESDTDIVSRVVYRSLSFFGAGASVGSLLGFIALVFILKTAVLWLFGFVRMLIMNDYIFNTRRELYEKTLAASWAHLVKEKVGYLDNILMHDVDAATGLLRTGSSLFLDMTSFVIYLGVAFSISSFATLVTAVLALLGFAIAKPLIGRNKFYSGLGERLKKEISHRLNEFVLGFKTVKALGVQRNVAGAMVAIFERSREFARQFFFINSVVTHPLQLLSALFIIVVFAVAYYLDPNFDLAKFFVTMYLLQRLFGYVESGPGSVNSLYRALPYARRIINFQAALARHEESVSGREPFRFERTLAFENVSFAYGAGPPILDALSFTISKGEVVGIIGPSGAGKTTIADLLLRLLEPTSGTIRIDGEDARSFELIEWRQNVGYVAQDLFLRNDTIANNIVFYDPRITQARMLEAARLANIYDFVQSLPKSFETVVGERGLRFSGGERQRIVLARAFAREPKILILDEATSALDGASETLIKKAIEAVKDGVTVVIIAHRLSTVMDVDRLLVIEDGRLVEEGAPEALLNDKTSYFYKAVMNP